MPTSPLPQFDTDVGLSAWSAFLRAHAAVVHALEGAVEAETGVPLRWYDVLLELSAAPGGRLRMQDLADRAVLSRTRISRVVGELAEAGMVERHRDPADGRGMFAVVTPLGRRTLRRAAPVYLELVRTHFVSHLGAPEMRAIRDGLEAVVAANAETTAS